MNIDEEMKKFEQGFAYKPSQDQVKYTIEIFDDSIRVIGSIPFRDCLIVQKFFSDMGCECLCRGDGTSTFNLIRKKAEKE